MDSGRSITINCLIVKLWSVQCTDYCTLVQRHEWVILWLKTRKDRKNKSNNQTITITENLDCGSE